MAVYDQYGHPLPDYRVPASAQVRARPMGQLDPLPPCDLGKAQWIRIADVVVVGPLMIAGGLALRKSHPIAGYGLLALGVGTIGLNGYNYVRFARDFGHVV